MTVRAISLEGGVQTVTSYRARNGLAALNTSSQKKIAWYAAKKHEIRQVGKTAMAMAVRAISLEGGVQTVTSYRARNGLAAPNTSSQKRIALYAASGEGMSALHPNGLG